MENKKKWLTQLLIFGITFVIAFFAARMIFSGKTHSEQLSDFAEIMNKKAPFMVDAETRLDNVKVSGDTLQYDYTLVNISKEDGPDIKGAKKFLINQSQTNLDSNPEMKDFKENNISLKYHYRDKKGEELLSFKVSPNKKKSKTAK